MAAPKYPHIVVQLSGEDGNGFAIVSKVRMALKRGVSEAVGLEYYNDALSGDYDHLISTTAKYVTVR